MSRQRAINTAADDWWTDYTEHRERVTSFVLGCLGERPRGSRALAVLGAGNGNDLDLRQITEVTEDVTLLDLDDEAMQRARLRHGLEESTALSLEVCDLLTARAVPVAADVVLSAGVLTQLLESALVDVDTADHDGSAVAAAMVRIRDHHLDLMTSAALPSGVRVLVTDVVSSATCPELLDEHPPPLESLLLTCVETKNFFTGTNPFAIRDRLRSGGLRSDVHISRPWIWRMGRSARLACLLAW